MTVRLRPVAGGDERWAQSWLPAVGMSVGYESDAGRLFGAEDPGAPGVRIIERDGVPAGVIVFRANRPGKGSAIVELVATPPEHARRGTGMVGMALVEAELRKHGVQRLYAPAPEVHGIAMYFWIRLGYRPLPRAAWPCDRPGVAWLARDAADDGGGGQKPNQPRTASKTSSP